MSMDQKVLPISSKGLNARNLGKAGATCSGAATPPMRAANGCTRFPENSDVTSNLVQPIAAHTGGVASAHLHHNWTVWPHPYDSK